MYVKSICNEPNLIISRKGKVNNWKLIFFKSYSGLKKIMNLWGVIKLLFFIIQLMVFSNNVFKINQACLELFRIFFCFLNCMLFPL